MTQAIAKTEFLEIPQDSHIEDPNKEDSDLRAQMRFLICVSVVRSSCVRNIDTSGMTLLIYLLQKQQLLKKLYHGSGNVIADELAYISVLHDHKERVYLSKN